MRIAIAFRAFFAALFNAAAAQRIKAALESPLPLAGEKPAPKPAPAAPAKPSPPVRSEALTLLSALQREARFIDLVHESLDQYSDEQVGAAARGVLKDCRSVCDRLFELEPVLTEEEGAEVEVSAGYDTGRYRLTGNVSGQPPFRGKLVHHGWQSRKCEMPQWSGSQAAARVVAAAEVELA